MTRSTKVLRGIHLRSLKYLLKLQLIDFSEKYIIRTKSGENFSVDLILKHRYEVVTSH